VTVPIFPAKAEALPIYLSEAIAAKSELRRAARAGPDLVADNRLTQAELDFDIAAWTAIAQLLETGKAQTDLRWPDLERAARSNWLRRQDAIDANQDPDRHSSLLERAEHVAAILICLRRNRRLLTLAAERPLRSAKARAA
jgi:hypothetical protein